MEEARSKKTLAIVLWVLAGTLTCLLLVFYSFYFIHRFMSATKVTASYEINVESFTERDLENGVTASALLLAGRNDFGDASVSESLVRFCPFTSVSREKEQLEQFLMQLWGDGEARYQTYGDEARWQIYVGDFDNDGEEEILIAMSDCLAWAEKAGNETALQALREEESRRAENHGDSLYGTDKVIFLYVDSYNDVFVYQFIPSFFASVNVDQIYWGNNELRVSTARGNGSFFLCDAWGAMTLGEEEIADRYEAYLIRCGIPYVYRRSAYLSDNGVQYLFVFGNASAYPDAGVYELRCGRAIPLYQSMNYNNTALYLVTRNGRDYLLTYRNWDSNGRICYEYTLFRFGMNFSVDLAESGTVPESEASNATAVTAFFESFRSLIRDAVVCSDPYQLTGYTTTLGNASGQTETARYLHINNCDTSKSGVVMIKPEPDNWLNLRVGPAKSYDRVMVRGDFVQQARGSVVTVVDTVNTNDSENPIWVKININYGGEHVTGYSSQRYIVLDSIRHVAVGESFTITASTNDSGLSWQVNDPNVAEIRSDGTIIGRRKGLVLVTVRSASGLEDSCLVAVD